MMNRTRPIRGELLRLKEEIEQHAINYGLDFYPVVFEMCDYDTVNILAAQGGFPSRYPHWRFGMEYDQLSKNYAYGMAKIYEMVINTDPCYAYLLNTNKMVDQKTVMAHVYGHADFFKHNAFFRNTNTKMMDTMANHGTKIRRYMDRYGQNQVEEFIDRVLSLENLLDPSVLFDTPELTRSRKELDEKAISERNVEFDDDRSSALKSYMRSKKRAEKEKMEKNSLETSKEESVLTPIEDEPTQDIMRYLMLNAPLKEWEADVIGILREEAYYFLPQRITKIMNEGWASYWHSTIMTKNIIKSSEIVDFADHHAGVMAMGKTQINPYKIGIELFRDIEFRWDTGRFGKEYLECTNMYEKEKWDKKTNLGREKIFEVRRTHNDLTFIDEFFTEEFCQRMQLFTYHYNPRTGRNEIQSKEFEDIKTKLLSSLTNGGQPIIKTKTGNFKNRSELLLEHTHYGVDLDLQYTHATLQNVYHIWRRPVNISTKKENKPIIYCFDGKEMKQVNP